jgi:hypothetical protein
MRAREDALASINHIPKTQATDRFVRTQKSGPDRQRSRHPVRIGGVGEGERAELDALSNQYNLRLLFAKQDSGEYLSAVQVNILDAQGGTVLTAESSGPWFFTPTRRATTSWTSARPVKACRSPSVRRCILVALYSPDGTSAGIDSTHSF